MELCNSTGQSKITNTTLSYTNTIFHRIYKDSMAEGGDVNNTDGEGGESIYGETFDDENFNLLHTKPYLLSMVNNGTNTNNSKF